MATLTIRNLDDRVHDALRQRAAANRRSMEAEARAVLEEQCSESRKRLSPEEFDRLLKGLNAKASPLPADARMLLSEAVVADRRLEALLEEGLVSAEENLAWRDQIDRLAVSLDEVEAFFRSRWPWTPAR